MVLQPVDNALDRFHERGFAGAPIAEDADRQRRLRFFERGQPRQRDGLGARQQSVAELARPVGKRAGVKILREGEGGLRGDGPISGLARLDRAARCFGRAFFCDTLSGSASVLLTVWVARSVVGVER